MVTVPPDCECQKMRVTGYRVVAEANGPLQSKVLKATREELEQDAQHARDEKAAHLARQKALEDQLKKMVEEGRKLSAKAEEAEAKVKNTDVFTAQVFVRGSAALLRFMRVNDLDDPKLEAFVRDAIGSGLNVIVNDTNGDQVPLEAII